MRQSSVLTDKKAQGQQPAGLLGHAAVRTHPNHAVAAGMDSDLRTLTHDHEYNFANIPARTSAPTAPANYATPACPVFPRRCPFGGVCRTCPATVQTKLTVNQPGDIYEQEADRVAESVMRMPESAIPTTATSCVGPTTVNVPPIVHEVLRSPGQPLDPNTRSYFEPRFGHDFSQVRVHTDRRASESAQAVNARAYTVGHDIVFDAGQYRTLDVEGRQLIAHELTHVAQQARGLPTIRLQREKGTSPRPAPVDANAQRIIDLAKNANRSINERAVEVVRAIIKQYFPRDTAKISKITYVGNRQGLHSTYAGRGATTTGIIQVGRYFVENTTQRHFARRVLQVRHEIEHVEQQRTGMRGSGRQDEREFIAFYHEALATELTGTGQLQHSTRVQLIDGALGYYFCLSADLQQANTTRRQELLTRRTQSVKQSHRRDLGEAPTGCRRQSP